tara:strand:- start:798 stop:1400 length:603 start_codon:yes stop_codon:yes gene_type:complete
MDMLKSKLKALHIAKVFLAKYYKLPVRFFDALNPGKFANRWTEHYRRGNIGPYSDYYYEATTKGYNLITGRLSAYLTSLPEVFINDIKHQQKVSLESGYLKLMKKTATNRLVVSGYSWDLPIIKRKGIINTPHYPLYFSEQYNSDLHDLTRNRKTVQSCIDNAITHFEANPDKVEQLHRDIVAEHAHLLTHLQVTNKCRK